MKKFRTEVSLFNCGEPNQIQVDIAEEVNDHGWQNSQSFEFEDDDAKDTSGTFDSQFKIPNSNISNIQDTSTSSIDDFKSPTVKDGAFFGNHLLATTPPTGKRTSSAGSTGSDPGGDKNNRRQRERDRQGKKQFNSSFTMKNFQIPLAPKLTPSFEVEFKEFLKGNDKNWDQIMLDIKEIEEGRGSLPFKNIQKEKRHQLQQQPQLSSSLSSQEAASSVQILQTNNDTCDLVPSESVIVPTVESSLSGSIRKQPISSSLKRSSLDKSSRLANTDVPRFYWPEGKPDPNSFVQASILKAEDKLKTSANSVNYSKFGELLQAVGIPLYWKKPFWMALSLPTDGQCSSKIFIPFLRYLLCECPDDASRFIRIVSSASKNFSESLNGTLNNNNRNSKYYMNHGDFCQDMKQVELSMSDFIPMVQDIIDTHPGLGFLRDAPEFHSRYVTTVISRIFYKVNRSWSCRISLTELRRSNLLRVIKRLEEETDINSITEYFSYEHFYVIYCKFWELDKDHDLLIDKHDLSLHADHALSSRIIDRIFSGTVLRGWDVNSPVKAASNKMTYSDFVWFLLSEEDKKTPTAIEYWFRCLDLDGDGIISPYELQYFYSEQESRIESLGIEPLHFSNVYCQIVDMLHCSPTGIRLRDLKRNAYLAANVFNTVFNLDKYLEHEQRDPFAAASSLGNVENTEGESDWDKYASAEYELLIAEETPSEHLHDSGLEEVLTP